MNRATMLACVVLLFATAAFAQSAIMAPGSLAGTEQPKHCYAMSYVVKELDGTKVVNQRSYALNTFALAASTVGGEWTRLRVGNRVPVFVHGQEKGSGTPVTDFNYIDVGVNIDNRLRESADALVLEVTADISSIAGEASNSLGQPPTVRQVKGTSMSTIYPGKPATVFAADDPTSQHRFELQVTATLIR